jgi:hypothetical protein
MNGCSNIVQCRAEPQPPHKIISGYTENRVETGFEAVEIFSRKILL